MLRSVVIASAENTAAPKATSTPTELPPSVRCGPIVISTPTKPMASARPAISVDALAEQHHREHASENIGAVKLIAVKSASGIIVSAVNQQNMLAVPANERSACDFNLAVRKILQAFDAPGDEPQHDHGDHAADEDDLPRRHTVAQVLHARGEAREQHDRRELQRDAEDRPMMVSVRGRHAGAGRDRGALTIAGPRRADLRYSCGAGEGCMRIN